MSVCSCYLHLCIDCAEWLRFYACLWRALDLEADLRTQVNVLETSVKVRLVSNLHISLCRTQSS